MKEVQIYTALMHLCVEFSEGMEVICICHNLSLMHWMHLKLGIYASLICDLILGGFKMIFVENLKNKIVLFTALMIS